MSGIAYIKTGATERIEALALDGNLDPLTGLTDLLIAIRRVSDDFFYDFDDDTFKAAGWTDRQLAMTEIDAVNAEGEYAYDFDTSVITNPVAYDTYMFRVEQDPGTDVANVPLTGQVKVGLFLDGLLEGPETYDEALRIMRSALAGLSGGGGSANLNFRDRADSKDRIAETVDPLGNRIAVVTDGT